MILVVSTCQHELSELEFVRPITDLIEDEFVVKHYSKINNDDLVSASKVIICGTALKDFDYLKGDWSWLKTFQKPVLGVCAGFQLIAESLGLELINEQLIGVFNNYYFVTSRIVKGGVRFIKQGNFVAYAFHPEVLNPELITSFLL